MSSTTGSPSAQRRAAKAQRGRPPRTSKAEIIAAALELVDTEGIEALSLRRLAEHTGLAVMTLYKHVDSKERIVQDVIAHAMSALELDLDSTDPWREQVHAALYAMYVALKQHPGVVELLSIGTPLTTPAVDRRREGMITILRRSGMSHDRAADTFHYLGGHLLGLLVIEGARRRHAGAMAEHLRTAPRDQVPQTGGDPEAWVRPVPDALVDTGLRHLIDALTTDLP